MIKKIKQPQMTDRLPTVVLIGRVNVGKSTLFNRMIEERKALVSPIPGTTRTRNEGRVEWRSGVFLAVDTGGLSFDESVPLESEIIAQSEAAVKKADCILFVIDGKEGILPQEYALAKRLWKKRVPMIIAVNKIDSGMLERNIPWKDISRLNLSKTVVPVSATSGRNVGDLLDIIVETLAASDRPIDQTPDAEFEGISVAIIGRPNVGKSSLFNKLIGEDRVIVSEMPHTTREPHDTTMLYAGKKDEPAIPITFIDTAGIRRKSHVWGSLERQGIQKSIETIRRADIVLFVLDITEPFSHQDKQLGSLLERQGKSVVILLNKWDKVEDASEDARNVVIAHVRSTFPYLSFASIVFVSGKTGYRVHQILPLLPRLQEIRKTEIPNEALRHFLEAALRRHKPSRGKGTRHPDLLGMTQTHTRPPIFQVVVKYRTSLHRSYLQYLEHQLREHFDFLGCPILITIKKQKK